MKLQEIVFGHAIQSRYFKTSAFTLKPFWSSLNHILDLLSDGHIPEILQKQDKKNCFIVNTIVKWIKIKSTHFTLDWTGDMQVEPPAVKLQ